MPSIVDSDSIFYGKKRRGNEGSFPEEPWRVCSTFLTEKAAQARA